MKDIENDITNGWMIDPPEDIQKARRWIKTVEAVSVPATPADNCEPDHKANHKKIL